MNHFFMNLSPSILEIYRIQTVRHVAVQSAWRSAVQPGETVREETASFVVIRSTFVIREELGDGLLMDHLLEHVGFVQ